MKKLKLLNIMLLVFILVPFFVSCSSSSDSIEKEESDLEKLYRLANVNADEYEMWKQNSYTTTTGTNYVVFTALKKTASSTATTTLFNIWLFNKNTNKIITHSGTQTLKATDSYYKTVDYYFSYSEPYSVSFDKLQSGVVIEISFIYDSLVADWQRYSTRCYWFNNDEELTYIEGTVVGSHNSGLNHSTLNWYNNTFAVACRDITAIIDSAGKIIKTLPNNVNEFVNPELEKIYYYLETYDYDKGLRLCMNNKGSIKTPIYYLEIDFLDYTDQYNTYRNRVLLESVILANPYHVDTSAEIISSDDIICKVRLTQKLGTGDKTYIVEINKKEKTAKYVDN